MSEGLSSFTEAPHAAIDGPSQGTIVNLVDARAVAWQQAQLGLVHTPEVVTRMLRKQQVLPHLHLPAHHDVRADNVIMRRVHGALAAAAERGPRDFADLLLTPGLGARTLFTLAQVAEVVHGAPCRFSDPARFSLALGGKDGHPFPVPLAVYDQTLSVMRTAISAAKLGNDERLSALQRLDAASRRLEKWDGRAADRPSFERFVERERAASHSFGGMTVNGPARPPAKGEQLGLFAARVKLG